MKIAKWNVLSMGMAVFCMMSVILCIDVQAKNKQTNPPVIFYENDEAFSLSKNDSVSALAYGKNFGSMLINGDIERQTTKGQVAAYAVNGNVSFGFLYSTDSVQPASDAEWSFVSSDEKAVGDLIFPKKIGNGTISIQKSYDNKTWTDACEPIQNAFTNKKIDFSSVYSTTDEDIKNGTYYRVLILYEMKKKAGTEKGFLGFTEDVFEYKYCIEEYTFYLSYAWNPVKIINLTDGKVMSGDSKVASGFKIDAGGANVVITIQKDNGDDESAKSLDAFYSPGLYTISAKSPLGDVFKSKVTITEGMSTYGIKGSRYENIEKDGYSFDNMVTDGMTMTSLMIGQKAGTTIKNSSVKGYGAYGITGDRVHLFMKLLDPNSLLQKGWEVVPDDWGKNEKQRIADAWVGRVASGALVIQKSKDAENWENIDAGKYTNGLYTTDFYTYYGGKGDTLVYSPDGKDVMNGVFIRVLYAYEKRRIDEKEKIRVIEDYSFYLCSDELGAVTFHNLTLQDKNIKSNGERIKENASVSGHNPNLKQQDENMTSEICKSAETMESGAVTVTGFSIDKTLNPTVTCTVVKDGQLIDSRTKNEFTETGRYEIKLTSAIGSTKNITLFVDCMSEEETLKKYFGEGFIKDKRIFAEGSYPVFEAGKTRYNMEAIPDNLQPLYGKITNVDSGITTDIVSSKSKRAVELTEPGEYTVVLNNNPTYKTQKPSGDNKEITFRFNIIAEGTAPGPQVNRKNLSDSMRNSMSGLYPKYYGLIYTSAERGNITLAFSSWDDAYQYAYNYEKGTVEKQSDGTYLYTGSFMVDNKTRYDSEWDLTDAFNYFAQQAIHEMYFDMSDEASYLTLEENVLENTKNPRTLELRRSVVIFADEQKEQLSNIDALPILNSRPFAYLSITDRGNTKIGKSPFEFIKDKYGCDSYTVSVIDCEGKEYTIDYNKDVEKQLSQMGCKTGKVTIDEKTIYGDGNPYEAVFFADGANTAEVKVLCYGKDGEETITLTQDDDGANISADAFSIQEISDDLDPYNLLIIKDANGNASSYVADESMNGAWSDDGVYEVSVVNRIGNKFSFKINITDSEFATIAFSGNGTEGFQSLVVKRGDQNVKLPIPERYGYDFAGYSDEDGTIYEDVIEQIPFNGKKVLSPKWNRKTFEVVLKNDDGSVIEVLPAKYGYELEIPDQTPPEGYVFDGWKLNGELLSDNTITVTEEGDIILIASMSKVGGLQTINTEENNGVEEKIEDKGGNTPVIIILGLFVLVCIIALIIWIARKRSNSDHLER